MCVQRKPDSASGARQGVGAGDGRRQGPGPGPIPAECMMAKWQKSTDAQAAAASRGLEVLTGEKSGL